MIFKQNKYIILAYTIMLLIIGYSFYQYYDENFSYAKDYYTIKENCYERKNINHQYCKRFMLEYTDKYINTYIEESNPKEKYKRIDAITLTSEIVENTTFSILQFFSPLIILIAFVGTIHSDFSSGIIKNYLLRMKYSDYLKKVGKLILKVSLITPISLIIIFLFSMIFTKFNFDISNVDINLSVYDSWKYNNFIAYGILICLIQFFVNILYCNIGLYCCKKNKNKLIAIIMSYIVFLLTDLFIYIVLYAYIINKMLGFKELTEYFNITGYWFFTSETKIGFIVLISSLLAIISSIFIYYCYKDKEGVINASEIQIT